MELLLVILSFISYSILTSNLYFLIDLIILIDRFDCFFSKQILTAASAPQLTCQKNREKLVFKAHLHGLFATKYCRFLMTFKALNV